MPDHILSGQKPVPTKKQRCEASKRRNKFKLLGNGCPRFGKVLRATVGFTNLCLFIHVPGKGDSIVRDLFNVPDGVEALLVVSYGMEREKGLSRVARWGAACP